MPELIFMNLGMYIMAPKPIPTAYFINPYHQSVCLHVCLPIASRQGLGKNVTAVKNTHAKVGLLDSPFSMPSVPYELAFCFRCIVYIMWVLLQFLWGYLKCSMLYNWDDLVRTIHGRWLQTEDLDASFDNT
jgi:hypothetical protein